MYRLRVSGRIRGIDGHEVLQASHWEAHATPPDAVTDPRSPELLWRPASEGSATTAAAALRAAGGFSLDDPSRPPTRRLDADDWWFRTRLPAIERATDDEIALVASGIATVADVWLDGAPLLETDNMFRSHERVLERGGGELVIRCRALDTLLGAKRPRPRWKAPMIESQQLRWFRTTLLGRTPGWSPPAAAVGPWRGVHVERRRGFAVDDVSLRTAVSGSHGTVEVTCRLRALGAARDLRAVELVVERDGREHVAKLVAGLEGALTAHLTIADVHRWWPHTHGEPAVYHARLLVGPSRVVVDLGSIGFREVTRDGDFAIVINGAPVFCRGACWTPLDVVTLSADRAATERALLQVRDAGMNMLRVSGTMTYESDDFYDLCDELGILVWQDFMFANMDYPEEDARFAENVAIEARQILSRLQARPSLAVLCGNSEGEQQAAMFGAPRDRWSPKLFHDTLAALSSEKCPDVPYWPSSAHGGAFPHEPRVGTTSYYGVGAYLRPLDDARRAEVRFASECLAFANVPEATPPAMKVHHPAWKARTPRDLGAGWDFDDVRDHYVERLFGADPMTLRYADHDRYLDLGRAATGEVMAAVFGEWRRQASTCRGGLLWFLRDLWSGAGWGVVDAAGRPKSAYWYLRRALAPVAVHVSDEGNSGLYVHVANDRPGRIEGELEIALFRAGEIAVGSTKRAIAVEARSAATLAAAASFDGFMDLSNAYRFGPAACDLVVATLRDAPAASGGVTLAETFHFPVGLPSARELDLGLVASARERSDGAFDVTVRTRRFAQSVVLEADGFTASDAWFHLAPSAERTVVLTRSVPGATAPLKGTLRALNSELTPKIVLG